MSNRLFKTKPLHLLMEEADEGKAGLKKTLNATQLILLGIGAIIGAGLFVRTAAAAANNAGPSVTLGFIIAGLGCAFAGLCYAEFASMIPISGSAYTYSYATMGEFTAWIIGWDLVLEYALGAATVSIAWSEYLNNFSDILTFKFLMSYAIRRCRYCETAPVKLFLTDLLTFLPCLLLSLFHFC
jgi:basic amino acid/polyamine antiporter, APA family